MSQILDVNYFLKWSIVLVFVSGMFSAASGTEIESGYIQPTSEGNGFTEDSLGFRPDYIEFISAQQIISENLEKTTGTNRNCPQNVNGWSEGSVVFDDSGVQKQFTIGTFRNSDSTNAHTVTSSTSHVIKNVYVNNDGDQCNSASQLRISVTDATSNGFEYDVESNYNEYDEIVRYKAYQFPDNMEFDAGMAKVNDEGPMDVKTDFRPANVHIRAGMQINEKNIQKDFDPNDPSNALGRSKGYATFNESGAVLDQQSIGTATSSENTDAHRSLASDDYVLNLAYVDTNADLLDESEPSRLEVKATGADDNGFNLQVDNKWSQTDEVFLYRAWGFSYYDYQVGYQVIDSEGTVKFDTSYQGESFEPDAIDIYAEQQIGRIDNEVATPENQECDNAGGWSNGYYETDDNNQWSLGMGRTSDSQNAHRQVASTAKALKNFYADQDGNDKNCGKLYGEVIQTMSDGFEMDFTFGENFNSNYAQDRTYNGETVEGGEMVYYRALDFKLVPPTTDSADIYDKSTGHAFGIEANITEGSNDIQDCEITVEGVSPGEGVKKYDAEVDNSVSETYSLCKYEWIRYNDTTEWEGHHNTNDALPIVNVTVEATGSDGLSSETNYTVQFPNHAPDVESISFSNYTSFHGFDTYSVIRNNDSVDSEEIESCEFVFDDGVDGHEVTVDPSLDHSYGDINHSRCTYDNVNRSMPDGKDSYKEGFEVLEDINVAVNVTDHHGAYSKDSSSNAIPNTPPAVDTSNADSPNPLNESYVSDSEIELSSDIIDRQGDRINATIYSPIDGELVSESMVGSGPVDVNWEVPDATDNEYTWIVETEDYWDIQNTTFTFTKQIGQTFRSRVSTQLNYSSLIMNAGSNKYSELAVRNDVRNDKNLTITLSGVKAEFLNGKSKKDIPNFEGKSQETYALRINPDSPTDGNLNVEVRNNDLGITTTESIPVRVLESTTQSSRDVPGVGMIQLLFIVSAATVLYSVRL